MRVLVTSVPQSGHLHPLLSLAKAFAEQGDDVLVACAADVMGTAERAGLRATPTGASFGVWWQALGDRTRGAPGDGIQQDRVIRYFTPRLFGEIGAPITVDDLLTTAREWRPDLLVADSYAFAAPLVARLVGTRYVHHLLGPAIEPLALELTADALSPMWRSFGETVPAWGGIYDDITLTICPPALEPQPGPDGALVLPLRPVPLDSAGPHAVLPDFVASLAELPLVYVTLGTFSNNDHAIFHAVIDALAGEPLSILITVGANNDPAAFGVLPPNVRVERYVPQSLLLPYCTIGINHAGSGTMLGAFSSGLPQLVVPQGADNFVNADRAVQSQAALQLLPGDVDAAAVRQAVRRLLGEPSFRSAARSVAAEIAAMPSPAEVATGLRDLVAEGHRGRR